MIIKYRCAAHHVTSINDKYGYYKSIEYKHKKRGWIQFETENLNDKEWPLRVYVAFDVSNHEDLTRITDAILDVFDSTRGEFGEHEVRSPSSIILLK
jgi:hypothetical protein